MILKPVNLVYLGDLYRFYVDLSCAPNIELAYTEKYEMGSTHSDRVDWSDVPLVLKEMLIEKISAL